MKRLLAALAVAVVARMAFHAVFLPAFEGPDEPQHLARVRDFAERPLAEGFAGRLVDAQTMSAMAAYPCRSEMHIRIGCPEFGSAPGAFDLVRSSSVVVPAPGARAFPNVESNQPPLFYFLAGMLLRPFHATPAAGLLACRLLAVALVAIALFGPLRVLARGWRPGLAVAGLLAMLLPGAAEGLARCSNDAAVFLWASLVLLALERPTRPVLLITLIAAGPLLKLTAIPIVVYSVCVCARERGKAIAAGAAAASLLVLPVQALRGWMWGGTIELNAAGSAIAEPFLTGVLGFLRSAYAFVKTTLWVGGFSLTRPPGWLVAGYGVLLTMSALTLRPRPNAPRRLAHAAAFAVAAAGFTVFALANRRYYGTWGGVAGWYLWGWSPWLAVAASDLGSIGPRAAKPLLIAEAAFVIAANAVWLTAHGRLYGW